MRQEARLSTAECAIELARAGRCTTIAYIRKTLHREQFVAVDQHLAGASIRKKLQGLILARRAKL